MERSIETDELPTCEKISWFRLPSEFGHFENLSKRVASWSQPYSPFDFDIHFRNFFQDVARALHRRQPRHLLLRRELGIGDNTILTEFARVSASGELPTLANAQIVRLDCRFVTPEECRPLTLALFAELARFPNVVLCINGLVPLLQAGGQTNNRSVFFSGLARTTCRIIATITPEEYEEHFSGRSDTDEFFSHLELKEPSIETSIRLVRHFANGLSEQNGVLIDDAAVHKAVVLSHSYIPSSRLPTKAVRILSEASDDLVFDRLQGKRDATSVTVDDVIERVAAISGVPAKTLGGLPDGVDYREALRSRIVGQDEVIDEVATELNLIRAGMVDSGKPSSVMLFVGQTGTGKTELAKVVSHLYSASKRLKTFTLGNYSEPHSVSGIIGVPPGYVGHDHGGRLVNELNSDPYSVFLLDEADKAHPDVMQPFLNLFDEGWIVDQRGVKAYAERAIFILTTNVGQRQIAEMQRKGKDWDEIHTKLMESLSQIKHAKANRPVFSPEFLARLKRVIIFRPLDETAMEGITRQLCDDLIEKWHRDRQKNLHISESLINEIAAKSQEQNEKSKGKEGGRIVRKLIANSIEAGLQAAIAFSPSEYKEATQVDVELGESGFPKIDVRFRQQDVSQ